MISAGGNLPITASAILPVLLRKMVQDGPSAAPNELAALLGDISANIGTLGRKDLADRAARLQVHLSTPQARRHHFMDSNLHADLREIHDKLTDGKSVDEALDLQESAQILTSIVEGRRTRATVINKRRTIHDIIGPEPVINWSSFGSKQFPAPPAPDPKLIKSFADRLSYFVHYVATRAAGESSAAAFEVFYGVTSATRQNIALGDFISRDIGRFPSGAATSLISSAYVEPNYARLMQELIIRAFYEVQGWSGGMPTAHAPWYVWMLHELRRFVATGIISQEYKKEIIEDKALIRAVKGQIRLTDTVWYPGKTRREVFEKWFKEMGLCFGNCAKSDELRDRIVEGILAENPKWQPPEPRSPKSVRLQWLLRLWIAKYCYGDIPANGIRFDKNSLRNFAYDPNPKLPQPELVNALLEMMGGFYTQAELMKFRFGE